MLQNQIQEVTLFASQHDHVEKRLYIAGVVFSSLLAILGVVCFFVTTQLPETSSTWGMSSLVLGTAFLLTAVFCFFWKSKRLVYTPTGSMISARSMYFDPSFEERLTEAVSRGQLCPDPVWKSSVSGSVRLDVLMSEDGSFGAIQLFRYISYTYKPLTSIVYLSGDQVIYAKDFVNQL
ncbi:MAG: hypothetical protein LUF85_04035 [Bacteroides sp.]|nr:hypothetical protein [Bacteroides sp.]